jgi:hypothetical protein
MNSASALQLAVHNWKVLPHAETKAAFAKAALEFLQDLAGKIPVCAAIRHDRASPVSSGTLVSHSDALYVLICSDSDVGIIARGCRCNTDYVGLANHIIPFASLATEVDLGLPTFRRALKEGLAAREPSLLSTVKF